MLELENWLIQSPLVSADDLMWNEMNPWVETLGVAVVVSVGVLLGRWYSRLPKW
jgi:hypothetical protein